MVNTVLIQVTKFYFSVYRYSSGYTAVGTNNSISKRDVIWLPHLEMGNSRSPSCQCNPSTAWVIKQLWCGKRRGPQKKAGQWARAAGAQSGRYGGLESMQSMDRWVPPAGARRCRWAKKQPERERLFKPPGGILWSPASKLLQTTLVLLLSLSLPCQPFADFRWQGMKRSKSPLCSFLPSYFQDVYCRTSYLSCANN